MFNFLKKRKSNSKWVEGPEFVHSYSQVVDSTSDKNGYGVSYNDVMNVVSWLASHVSGLTINQAIEVLEKAIKSDWVLRRVIIQAGLQFLSDYTTEQAFQENIAEKGQKHFH